jgi:hypothetical protein
MITDRGMTYTCSTLLIKYFAQITCDGFVQLKHSYLKLIPIIVHMHKKTPKESSPMQIRILDLH